MPTPPATAVSSASTPTGTPDVAKIRAAFPGLEGDTILLENAGGSQVPKVVADAVHRYMLESYVQLGAGYARSNQATETVEEAHRWIELLMNAGDQGKVILGPSCTQLVTMLAECTMRWLDPGDQIIVAESGHEANVGPWLALSRHGMNVDRWPCNEVTGICSLKTLRPRLSSRTRLVALPHVSNLLGGIEEIDEIIEAVHAVNAEVVVDGVAYAPHRAMDMQRLKADWYVWSTYKVYGPHMAALYGRHEAIEKREGPNHFFIPRDEVPYKFELGGVNHEGCAGLLALRDHLCLLAGLDGQGAVPEPQKIDRRTIERAYDVMIACELPLQQRLIEWIRRQPRLRLIGPDTADLSRVPTISFTHASKSSREIAAHAHTHDIGIRNGNMYSNRLCRTMGIDVNDGVVRVSAVHYNTPDEIERLIGVLEMVV